MEQVAPILFQKAWTLNKEKFLEPWHHTGNVYYAETAGKAKQMALSDADGILEKWSGEPFTFLTIPLVRAPRADKYKIGESVKTKAQIEYDEKVQQQNDELKKIVSDNPNGFAYIKKGGWYYRPDHCGYTEFLSMAGVYTVQEAARAVKGCSLSDCMQLVLINPVKHNEMINERIEDLKTRLIQSGEAIEATKQ